MSDTWPDPLSEGQPDIKQVPAEAVVRAAIRAEADSVAAALPVPGLPTRELLAQAAGDVLAHLHLPRQYLGFAMVAVDNALWAGRFRRVPRHRRLLLLPRCLSHSRLCQGRSDASGLACAGCGACNLPLIQREAESLGYQVIIAEGTSAVLLKVLEGEADALLGVACLDSLEKSFNRIADLGIPHQALPLLRDGCQDTEVELDLLRQLMHSFIPAAEPATETSYLPLLRETFRCFAPAALDRLLDPVTAPCLRLGPGPEVITTTDAIARDWLQRGGKRLRPFLTVATYAVGKHGFYPTSGTRDLAPLVPDAVRRLAVAIEALHKASLVHDDIEDDDAFRYGQPTLHRTHGVAAAINVGDYLVGLGYRLIASQAPELGEGCVADIMQWLSRAHLQLCCGQGGELLWPRHAATQLRPLYALQIAALKTAPAFAVALYTGLRVAEAQFDEEALLRFSTHLGEGFQTLNDLENWAELDDNKLSLGRDVLMRRPTVIEAFAREAGAGPELDRVLADAGDAEATLAAVHALYSRSGAFRRARQLLGRLRERSLDLAGQLGDAPVQQLLGFLVRNILRPAPVLETPGRHEHA